jgi:exonuclease III
MKIKVLTLNMEYGGSYLFDEIKNFSYLDNYVKLIKKHNIDIICFQEIILLHDMKPEINVAKKLANKLDYYIESNEASYISIISRFPLKRLEQDNKKNKFNIVCCKVKLDSETDICVCNVHLNDEPNTYYSLLGLPYNNTPFNVTKKQAIKIAWEGRKDDIKEMLQIINSNNMPTIVCGDFNEPSHLDNSKVKWKVSSTMYDNHFIDIVRHYYPSYKKYPFYTCDLDTQKKDQPTNPPMRIDMIYFRDMDPKKFKYMYKLKKNKMYLSDHVPILARFDV